MINNVTHYLIKSFSEIINSELLSQSIYLDDGDGDGADQHKKCEFSMLKRFLLYMMSTRL